MLRPQRLPLRPGRLFAEVSPVPHDRLIHSWHLKKPSDACHSAPFITTQTVLSLLFSSQFSVHKNVSYKKSTYLFILKTNFVLLKTTLNLFVS